MKLTNYLYASFLCATLIGCGGGQEVEVNPDYEPGYPNNYQEQIKHRLKITLKDPDSIKGLEITKPKVGLWNYGAFVKGPEGKNWGNRHYYACATYNAKNSYGGYVGYKTQTFFFDSEGASIKHVFDNGYNNEYWVYNCFE